MRRTNAACELCDCADVTTIRGLAEDCDCECHGQKKGLSGLHIEGRRWFQRGPGNTYHSVRIYANGEQLVYLPFQYGYGDGYLQTAIDWLKAEKLIPESAEYGTRYLREELKGTYRVSDVQRKQDL